MHAETSAAMRPTTRVHVGSVAKPVLALGVLRLVSLGKLNLEADVSAILPQLALENRWQRTDPIRVRHLLAHTAGLENVRFHQLFTLEASPDMPLAQGLAGADGLRRVLRRPGARYAYSNTTYLVLGMVIEAVTKERYETWLGRELLRPLGMHDSSFAFDSQVDVPGGARADPRLAMGHFEDGVMQAAMPSLIRPAGQFTTTAADMARFAGFLMGDGRLSGQAFIAPALMTGLATPYRTEAALAGLPGGRGPVLASRDRHGIIGQCHPGVSIGFRAMLCVYPQQRKAFFVSVNAEHETADYEVFNRALMRTLALKAEPVPMVKRAATPNLAPWEGMYVPSASQIMPLAWVDAVFNPVHVRRHANGLELRTLQADPVRLAPAGGNLLRLADRVAPSHVLQLGPDGSRTISDGLRHHDRVSWSYMIALWTSAALGVLGLVYVLVAGGWALGQRRSGTPMVIPFGATVLLLLPLPFLFGQSFLALGDLTTGAVLLAIVTGLLPLGLLAGLIRARRWPDRIALLAGLQWTLVLAAWGMLPFRLWH